MSIGVNCSYRTAVSRHATIEKNNNIPHVYLTKYFIIIIIIYIRINTLIPKRDQLCYCLERKWKFMNIPNCTSVS